MLTTGFINEGVATASLGETFVIRHPDLEEPDKDGVRRQLFIFLTPKQIDEPPKAAPAPEPKAVESTILGPLPDSKSAKSVRVSLLVGRVSGNHFKHSQLMVTATGNPQRFKELVRSQKGRILAEPSLITKDGVPATFFSGGALPLEKPPEGKSKVVGLTFGLKLEVLPLIQPDGKIWMRFRFEQTRALNESQEKAQAAPAEATAMTAGLLSEGVATVELGKSLFAVLPAAQTADSSSEKEMYFMLLIPEIVNGDHPMEPANPSLPSWNLTPTPEIVSENQPVESGLAAPPAAEKSFPVVEIQTQIQNRHTAPLKQIERAELTLEVGQTGILKAPEKIRSVSVTASSENAFTVLAEKGARKLRVQANQVGNARLLVTDIEGRHYHAVVDVKPDMGFAELEEMLRKLFPSANVQVITINESLLLRGSVTKEEHIKQITEIAEQYAEKVLNHLAVDNGLTRSEISQLPQDMRLQTVRAIVLGPEDLKEQSQTGTRFYEADVEMEWKDVAKGQPVSVFKPLMNRAVVLDYGSEGDGGTFDVILAVTPQIMSLLQLAERNSRLRIHLRKPGVGPMPRGEVNRETERLLRNALEQSNPSAMRPGRPTDSQPSKVPENNEVEELRREVKSLHRDVKRLIEILERKAAAKPQNIDPALLPPSGQPNYAPAPLSPTPRPVPNYGYPTLPIPPTDNKLLPPSGAPVFQDVPTKSLPQDLDASAFVAVRTARISSRFDPERPLHEGLGSGVVLQSEPGKAVILTAAHLLRNYQKGKFVLQVVAHQTRQR